MDGDVHHPLRRSPIVGRRRHRPDRGEKQRCKRFPDVERPVKWPLGFWGGWSICWFGRWARPGTCEEGRGVDRRTATLMYAGRNRKPSVRRTVPLTKRDSGEPGRHWKHGDLPCSGGAPALLAHSITSIYKEAIEITPSSRPTRTRRAPGRSPWPRPTPGNRRRIAIDPDTVDALARQRDRCEARAHSR